MEKPDLLLFNVPVCSTQQQITTGAVTTQNTIPKELVNRRYYLHQKMKNTYSYNSSHRIIYVPENTTIECVFAKELIENYNYTVQYIIE